MLPCVVRRLASALNSMVSSAATWRRYLLARKLVKNRKRRPGDALPDMPDRQQPEIQSLTSQQAIERVEEWFHTQGWQPFQFQRRVWEAYREGKSGLIHSATGTGKTYAAWMAALIEALAENDIKPKGLRVLWITPLRALAADTAAALYAPLQYLGLEWEVQTRTGDTSSSVKSKQRERLPAALVTTPESLSLFLSREDSEDMFAELKCVIVDEWHELMASKRGVQT